MKTALALMLLCLFVPQGAFAAAAPGYEPPAGRQKAFSVRVEWNDVKRQRKVPVRIYYPGNATGPFPVVIFSHGLGGSRDGYGYLGQYWAGAGYIAVHLQHLGSDNAIWENAGNIVEAVLETRKAVMDLRNAINRPLDVSFAIDRLLELNANPRALLRGKIDTNRIAVAGHSFGGFTSLAVAGQLFILPDGKEKFFRDERVKAVIEMSAPKSFNEDQLQRVYGRITIPTFHMTGTRDDSPVGETMASERRRPFEYITRAEQYLLTFQDGDHMVFSGRWGKDTEQDKVFQRLVCRGSVGFLDAYLKGTTGAREWLANGGFEAELGKAGTLEKKLAARGN